MPSIFKKKAQYAQEAKMVVMKAAAVSPPELKPLISIISSLVWDKQFKMAEQLCKKDIAVLDQSPEVRDLLCTILPEFALFVEIRNRAKEG